ncbi:WD40 repeat domain-containing serine/threonine protein kinase [Streptomyces sp. NPDC004126]|uniref:WD40 repeat domain-containing serine/threonine protein kinase n=1 Tax=Streptomyces sp. NPDC004126 TaxID=3390695 RepID=UPI003D09052B
MYDTPQVIAGRYRVIEHLGGGAMGQVWRALDERLDRPVALKTVVLPSDVATAEQLLAWSQREARSMARVKHPGVISVLDAVEWRGAPVIVMELVEGPSLDKVLRERGRLERGEVIRIGLALVDALGAAHGVGIVHRDVKPGNVLLEGERVVLSDFGVAHLPGATTLTSPHGPPGTMAYMAPELLRGGASRPECDLWSLGVMLYQMSEGRLPFAPERGAAGFIRAVIDEPPLPVVHARSLAPLLHGLLEKDPAHRYTGARARDALLLLGPGGGDDGSAGTPATADADADGPEPASRTPRHGPATAAAPTVSAAELLRPDPPGDGSARPSTVAPRPGTPARAPLSAPFDGVGAPVDTARRSTPSPRRRHLTRRTVLLTAAAAAAVPTGIYLTRFLPRRPIATLNARSDGFAAGQLYTVAFSPDGKLLASGGRLRLWDVASRAIIATLSGHVVNQAVFSPDGAILATAGQDGTARLWDVAARSHRATLTGHDHAVEGAAFSPDGKVLATAGSDSTVRLWDVAARAGTATLKGHTHYVNSVAFSPDGRTLATAGADGTTRLWDMKTQTTTAVLAMEGQYFKGAVFSPDGSVLAAVLNKGRIRLWDAGGRSVIADLDANASGIQALAFNRDGSMLACATKGGSATAAVGVWNVRRRESAAVLSVHTDDAAGVSSVAFSPDGETLAAAGNDGTVQLWSTDV